jgi:cytidylate kinase
MKITIFGFAWSGTSTIWKMLSTSLDYTFMSSGNIMREWASESWLSIYDFEIQVAQKDDSFDLKLDKKVQEFWYNNDNFIFESRLAWHFIKDSFKIYLHCDEDERYLRIQNREWLNLYDIKKKNTKRESELVERYNSVYKDIEFPPSKKDFDLFIDATDISPEEIINLILQKIKK